MCVCVCACVPVCPCACGLCVWSVCLWFVCVECVCVCVCECVCVSHEENKHISAAFCSPTAQRWLEVNCKQCLESCLRSTTAKKRVIGTTLPRKTHDKVIFPRTGSKTTTTTSVGQEKQAYYFVAEIIGPLSKMHHIATRQDTAGPWFTDAAPAAWAAAG